MYPQAPIVPQKPASRTRVDWSTGLCGCCACDDCMLCCTTCCCPCITFGRIAEIVDNGNTSCLTSGIVFYAMSTVGLSWVYSCTYRTKLRRQYSLKRSPCWDCSVHHWCQPCALCQEYRELMAHGIDPSIGWQGNVDMWNRSRGGTTMTAVGVQGMNR